MASVVYDGTEYKSKAELIRIMYEDGRLENTTHSKKEIAKKLGITIQTVHATLAKIVTLSSKSNKIKTVGKRGKVSENTIIRSGEEVTSKGKKIRICFAPNKWGLPITNPPIYVIDSTYKEDLKVTVDEENSTGELINF